MASIFISHISEEAPLAAFIKGRIEDDFLGQIDVFVSSDGISISAGSDWLQSVRDALDKAALEIVLCSPGSVLKPWVNFEAGAAWIKGVPIVPLCHSGLDVKQLPMPLLVLQGGNIREARTFENLYARLAAIAKVPRAPRVDFGALAKAASAVVIEPSAPDQLVSGGAQSVAEIVRSGRPDVFDSLKNIVLKHRDGWDDALLALPGLNDPRTLDFVSGLILKSASPVTEVCASVLATIGDVRSIPVLIKAFRLADTKSAPACLQALGEFAPQKPELVCPVLVEGLGGNEDLWRAASRAIARYDAAAVPALKAVLTSESWATVYWAVDAIGVIPDPTAIPELEALRKRVVAAPEFGGTYHTPLIELIDKIILRMRTAAAAPAG